MEDSKQDFKRIDEILTENENQNIEKNHYTKAFEMNRKKESSFKKMRKIDFFDDKFNYGKQNQIVVEKDRLERTLRKNSYMLVFSKKNLQRGRNYAQVKKNK